MLFVVAMVVAACSGGDGEAATTTTATTAAATATAAAGVAGAPLPAGSFAIRANADLGVGVERLLVAISGPDSQRLGSPDLGVTFLLSPEADPDQVIPVPASWVWAVPNVNGLYRATVEFADPGVYTIAVLPDGGTALDPIPVAVAAESMTPAIGDVAPPSESVTAAEVADLAEITTDLEPEPSFYEMSIADAVTSGRPSVIVFATPRFCQTAVCGPMLDVVKGVAPAYPDVNVVHVEVFTNLDDPENIELVPAIGEWNLPTEPWLFVVDGSGTIAGRFEGVIDSIELSSLLDSIS